MPKNLPNSSTKLWLLYFFVCVYFNKIRNPDVFFNQNSVSNLEKKRYPCMYLKLPVNIFLPLIWWSFVVERIVNHQSLYLIILLLTVYPSCYLGWWWRTSRWFCKKNIKLSINSNIEINRTMSMIKHAKYSFFCCFQWKNCRSCRNLAGKLKAYISSNIHVVDKFTSCSHFWDIIPQNWSKSIE